MVAVLGSATVLINEIDPCVKNTIEKLVTQKISWLVSNFKNIDVSYLNFMTDRLEGV